MRKYAVAVVLFTGDVNNTPQPIIIKEEVNIN